MNYLGWEIVFWPKSWKKGSEMDEILQLILKESQGRGQELTKLVKY